jgi:hypothetical protein
MMCASWAVRAPGRAFSLAPVRMGSAEGCAAWWTTECGADWIGEQNFGGAESQGSGEKESSHNSPGVACISRENGWRCRRTELGGDFDMIGG